MKCKAKGTAATVPLRKLITFGGGEADGGQKEKPFTAGEDAV